MGVKLGPRKAVAIPLAIPKQEESTRPTSSGSSSSSSSSSSSTNNPRTYPEYAYCLWTEKAINFLNAQAAVVQTSVAKKTNDYRYLKLSQSVGQNHWKFYKEVTETVNGQQVKKLKGVQVPCGIARARDIFAFAKTLNGIVRIVSPRGRAYYVSGGSSSSGGGGGGN